MRVLPDVATLEKSFDYLVPPALAGRVRVGSIVRVPLHGRRVRGFVLALDSAPPDGVRLLPLAGVTGWGPPADVVDLAGWAARRWAGRPLALLRAAAPPGSVPGLPPSLPDSPAPASVPGGPLADLATEALVRPRTVLRLGPAADPFPVVAAAAALGPALVVTASVDQSADLAARLRRAGHRVAHLPGGWAAAAAGGATVVGARAAAWAPVPGLAAVVVVDAHDEALQEERAPTWRAWEVGAERARRAGVPCVLVSPCPTLEQLAWGPLVTASRTEERAAWTPVQVVDRRHDDPRSGLFSPRLVEVLRRGGRVACVLNRKGRARLLACAACGELTRCERCAAAVQSPAGDPPALACRRCATTRPPVCQACGGSRLKNLKAGVTRAGEELAALAGEPVGEVTGETVALPGSRVLVGTEALLHRLPPAWVGAAVVFLDFDQELLAPRYRAGEQAMALLARAARAVGGREAGGMVVVQTRLPRHEVLVAAVHADPGRLVEPERARRAELRLPPFAALAQVSGEAAGAFVAALPGTVLSGGPEGGPFLVRAPDHRTLTDALAATPRPAGRLRVEVDPPRV